MEPFNYKITKRDGSSWHEGAHAIIKKDNKFLLVERRFYPFGWQCVAGHSSKGETPEDALRREVEEEIGIMPVHVNFLFTLPQEGGCPLFWVNHLNFIFSCEIDKEPKLNFESKKYGWFSREEALNLPLTKFCRLLFSKLS